MTDFLSLPSYAKDGSLHVVVESPRGSQVKVKYEPELGAFTLSRPLVLGLRYPYDWGFVPGTRADDGDPLDAMLLFDLPTYPGLVVPCRPIGVLELTQKRKQGGGRERNDRLMVVPIRARPGEALHSVDALRKEEKEELEAFFLHAVLFEDKGARVLGWKGPKHAAQLIRRARENFG
jgi:inorganic pyrophosphatase